MAKQAPHTCLFLPAVMSLVLLSPECRSCSISLSSHLSTEYAIFPVSPLHSFSSRPALGCLSSCIPGLLGPLSEKKMVYNVRIFAADQKVTSPPRSRVIPLEMWGESTQRPLKLLAQKERKASQRSGHGIKSRWQRVTWEIHGKFVQVFQFFCTI